MLLYRLSGYWNLYYKMEFIYTNSCTKDIFFSELSKNLQQFVLISLFYSCISYLDFHKCAVCCIPQNFP